MSANASDRLELDEGTGTILITLVDEQDWADERGHIMTLQQRLNAALESVESGDVFRTLQAKVGRPVAKNSPIQIKVLANFPMSPDGAQFFEYAKNQFSDARVGLIFRLVEDGVHRV